MKAVEETATVDESSRSPPIVPYSLSDKPELPNCKPKTELYKPFTITSTDVYLSPTASPVKKLETILGDHAPSRSRTSSGCDAPLTNGESFVCLKPLETAQNGVKLQVRSAPGKPVIGSEEGQCEVDSGMESAASSWDRSVAEVKEHAFARLQDELRRANEELKLRDEEVTRLSRIRQEVESELEDLTASLFQEAHKMVRDANIQQAAAERTLKEKAMQVEVLSAEVAALKTLVLTSTPSRPNLHLVQNEAEPTSSNKLKKHRRCPSHFNLKYGRENSPPDSPSEEENPIATVDVVSNDGCEVDPKFHKEFLAWRQNPTLDKSNEFIARIYREDIDQCLDFNNTPLTEEIRKAVDTGDIFIEAVSDKMKTPFKKCVLLESQSKCHYRLRLSNNETWYYISQICRNRITAVCNFLNYLRYIQRGLVKSSAHDIYWEIIRLRKEMMLARLGLSISTS